MGSQVTIGSQHKFCDRIRAAAILGLSIHWLEKFATEPGVPRCVRVGRKVWYRTEEVVAFRRYRDEQAARRAAEQAPGGVRPTPVPPDDQLDRAFAGMEWRDPHPKLTALETMAQEAGAWRAESLEGVEEWGTGIYETPVGILIHRRRAS